MAGGHDGEVPAWNGGGGSCRSRLLNSWLAGCGRARCGGSGGSGNVHSRLRFRGSEGDRTIVRAECGKKRNVGGHINFCGSVVFRVIRRWNLFAIEREHRRRGRSERFAAEGEAQVSGLAGNRGVHWRREVEDEMRRVIWRDRGREVSGDVADEKAIGFFVQGRRTTKKT